MKVVVVVKVKPVVVGKVGGLVDDEKVKVTVVVKVKVVVVVVVKVKVVGSKVDIEWVVEKVLLAN